MLRHISKILDFFQFEDIKHEKAFKNKNILGKTATIQA